MEPASAIVGSEHEMVINVHANHIEMVKFSSATEYRYIQIKNEMDGVFDRLARRREFEIGMLEEALTIADCEAECNLKWRKRTK